MASRARTTKKSGKQLDAEIASALARHRGTSHLTKPAPSWIPLGKALSEGNKTLLSIVQLAYPFYNRPTASVMVEISDHVDRRTESAYSHRTNPTRNDTIVWLYGSMAAKSVMPDAEQIVRTEVPLGAAYVSIRRGAGRITGSTVYLPPLESSTIDVAVDAVIESGHITPEVVEMIGSALQGRGGLLRKAYIAAVARIANRRIQAESRAARPT